MGTDSTESTDDSTSSLADSFAPEKMFGSTLSGTAAEGSEAIGEEHKNGVAAVHDKADASDLGTYGSLFGVEGNATWSAEVWVAKGCGYADLHGSAIDRRQRKLRDDLRHQGHQQPAEHG